MNTVYAGPVNRIAPPPEMSPLERVRALLELRGAFPKEQLRVAEEDGAIVLEGVVARYHDRQIALSCAQHVPGVRHIVDRIVVRESAPRSPDSADV